MRAHYRNATKLPRTARYRHAHVHPVGQSLEPRVLLAAEPVADLWRRPADSYPAWVTDVNGTAFFAATNNGVGRELYRSDGTPGGTTLVKDINPGPGGSDPVSLLNVDGTLYFIAAVGAERKELWKSDGTEAGTVRVSDNVNLHETSYLVGEERLAALGGRVYFRGSDGAAGVELWKSDGTDDGTVRVRDINPGPADSRPADFEPLGGVLLFRAEDAEAGAEVWKTDGTEAGTVRVKDVRPGEVGSFPHELTRSGEFVYFVAVNAFGARPGLWRTDGTEEGTALLTTQAQVGPGILDLTDVNGTLFFAEYTSNGNALWKSDGTPAGTALVRSFVAHDLSYGYAEELTNVDGALMFRLLLARGGSELWKSDGTPEGTVRLDAFGGPNAPIVRSLVAMGGRLYFSAARLETGAELWASDGTPGGARLVKDIVPGPGHSGATPLAPVGGRLFLSADTDPEGIEPWTSDGTAEGTNFLKDINPDTDGSRPHDLADVNGTLFFTTDINNTGTLIYKTNPTQDGVTRVVEGQSGLGPLATELEGSGSRLFYGVYQIGPFGGPWLATSDGTTQGSVEIDRSVDSVRFVTDLTGAGTVLFAATGWDERGRPFGGQELWRSDGTAAGTVPVKDINPNLDPTYGNPVSSNPAYLTNVGGTVFFAADDGANGRELWKSDGTEAGTVLVKDIVPGAAGSDPWGLVAVGPALFFRVSLPGGATELWKSDGTAAGTARVATLPAMTPPAMGYVYYERDSHRGAALGGVLVFAAGDPGGSASGGASDGVELWRSDGTEAGTYRLKDINPGAGGTEPRWFARYNDRVYFGAYEPLAGREFWSTDGTEAGTRLEQDLYPGVGSSEPEWLEVSGGTLWFSASGPTGGDELWKFNPDGPREARVVARHVFYNNSAFDAADPASPIDDRVGDDFAIASDKSAWLPGSGPASFANVTSYAKGINGVMIDVRGLPADSAERLSADDFTFRVRRGAGPAAIVGSSGWSAGAPAIRVEVRPRAGTEGSDRITLTWHDYNPASMSPFEGALANGWLEVRMRANADTGLAADDVFYFGNLIGEVGEGNPAAGAVVNALDLAAVKRGLNTDAPATGRLDFNRDGRVNALDVTAVKMNLTRRLEWAASPASPPTDAPARGHDADDRTVAASVLAGR